MDIYVQSTEYDRTIMSAQANLSGLYPPTEEEIWMEGILWLPIPVHTTPSKYDYALYGPDDDCPEFLSECKKFEKESPEAQHIYTEYKELFQYWSEKCGSILTTVDDIAFLYQTLDIEKLHGKS